VAYVVESDALHFHFHASVKDTRTHTQKRSKYMCDPWSNNPGYPIGIDRKQERKLWKNALPCDAASVNYWTPDPAKVIAKQDHSGSKGGKHHKMKQTFPVFRKTPSWDDKSGGTLLGALNPLSLFSGSKKK